MASTGKLHSLPSRILLPDGNTAVLANLSQEEEQRLYSKLCVNISRQLGIYYSSRPAAWDCLLDKFKRDSAK